VYISCLSGFWQEARVKIEVDTSKFLKRIEVISNTEIPGAVAKGFSELATDARDKVRERTRQEFDLHGNYITNGIKATPETSAQISAATNAFSKYGDLDASVYLRGSNDPKKSLSFMVNHETGDDKTAVGNMIAIPSTDLSGYNYRTSKGAVKAAWSPSKLLEVWNATDKGKRRRGDKLIGTTTGAPFIINTSKGPMIARKKGKELQFLYSLKPRAEIKKTWSFEDTVVEHVNAHGTSTIEKYVRRVR
jgi:hypothetical protein